MKEQGFGFRVSGFGKNKRASLSWAVYDRFLAFPCGLGVLFVLFILGGSNGGFGAEADAALKPEAGEQALAGQAKAAALEEIAAAFRRRPAVRARLEVSVHDELLGPRRETGELALLRPRFLRRRFLQPTEKIWLFNDNRIYEYAPARRLVRVTDLRNAPRTAGLLHAALFFEPEALAEHFSLTVFKKEGTEAGAPARLRLVLLHRSAAKQGAAEKNSEKRTAEQETEKKKDWADLLPQHRLQARWTAGAALFDELEYQPKAGDRTVERYTEIRDDLSLTAKDFAPLWPAGTVEKVEPVADPPGGETKKAEKQD